MPESSKELNLNLLNTWQFFAQHLHCIWASLIAQLVKTPATIPGLGRSVGEGISYPLQYSWASLVAQLVKNVPAMQETLVGFLGWEDRVKKGTATHSSFLAWRILWTVQSMGSQRVGHD